MKRLVKWLLSYLPRPWLISLSRYATPLLCYYYRGSRYVDPIDGRSFRKMLPYGYEQQRDNALSPSTLSLERHRLLWLYLQQKTDFFSAKKSVLHVAPEQPFHKRFREMSNLNYLTTDLYSPLADVKADLTNLPFEDNRFDIIFCNHVFEHILDDTKAMTELYRVMAVGGWGIFQIPLQRDRLTTYEDSNVISHKDRKTYFGQYDHVRIYGMDYFKRLSEAGFEVFPLDFAAKLQKSNTDKYCIDHNELIPLCKKL